MKKISFCDYHEGIRCTDADEEEVSKFYKLILQDEITAVQKNIHAQFILADPMKEFRGKAFWVKCKKNISEGERNFFRYYVYTEWKRRVRFIGKQLCYVSKAEIGYFNLEED